MPRPLQDQVVVVTGASSGIGRATALAFGRHGARVVVAARDADALAEVVAAIGAKGSAAVAVPTDVSHWPAVTALAEAAVATFGRIDCWVNNAAVSSYGLVEETPVADMERVVQVNLLGHIYGTKAALPHLRRAGGGVIINVASVLGVRAVPLQAAYTAAKHGVVGFSEALRLELAREAPGIAVVVVLPSTINTPLFDHARSRLGVQPRPAPPVYDPRLVADAIVAAAAHPRRDVVVGAAGKLLALGQRLSPALLDRLMLWNGIAFSLQRAPEPDDGADNLDTPMASRQAIDGDHGALTIPYRAPGGHAGATATRAGIIGGLAFLGVSLAVSAGRRRARAAMAETRTPDHATQDGRS